MITLEEVFGCVEINTLAPSLASLVLRGAAGQLEEQSLLSKQGVTPYPIAFMHCEAMPKPWARGACTYVVAEDGTRYESRNAPPDKVERSEDGKAVRLMGVTLAAEGRPPVATEDWTTTADGAELVWEIERRWLVDFKSVLSGSPGLFFGFHPKHLGNAVACTMWYDPERLAEQPADYYEIGKPSAFAKPRAVVTTDRDPWAIYKLWTSWPSTMDLRLQVEDGHLYKRGHLSVIGEAGAATGLDVPRMHRAGEVERIVLRIGAADKCATGHQLEITLPDHETERTFKNFYGSLLNGGSMADPKRLFNGNGCDSFECPVTLLWQGIALSAGVPAPGKLSSRSVSAGTAMRDQLDQLLGEANADGLFPSHYGGDSNGIFAPELGLYPLIGAASYVLHSGDAEFARRHLPTLERLPRYMLDRRDCRGLFGMDRPYLWYYDALPCSGVTTYHNALLFRGLRDLAQLARAVDQPGNAAEYERAAASLKAAINNHLWRENAAGGPRYVDFVDRSGRDITFFCDLCQWLPIAVGIASPEQARQVVATADARLKELEKSHSYPGTASLSALWPYNWPDCGKEDIEFGGDPAISKGRSYGKFGDYMYGGSLLTQTYWEVVARCRAGDADGAWNRLQRFARQARINGWSGDNAANIRGEMKAGDGEAYLADMVVVPAAFVHGILGIEMQWDGLTARPRLPEGWDTAAAEVLHRGRRHRVTAKADGSWITEECDNYCGGGREENSGV